MDITMHTAFCETHLRDSGPAARPSFPKPFTKKVVDAPPQGQANFSSPASVGKAHRPLDQQHDLASILLLLGRSR